MSTKHYIDDAEALVLAALESLTMLNPDLVFDKSQKAILSSKHDSASQVALISGGGAGHEPAHAAFVGDGMLTAAISGSIFASPSVSQIVNTVARAGGQAGTILIIKNYTGDIFHFYLAAEKARAKYGLKVGIIVVADDVSVGRAKSGKVGRRGLAGTVFVHKILGAMSRVPGKSFDSIVEMGKLVTDSLVTVGVSHGHVHIPGRPVPEDSLNHDQVELGMGIHNESGCQILSPRPSLPDLVKKMLDQLLDPNDSDRAYVDFKDAQDVVLLVNNLGSLSVLELGGITHEAVSQLKSRGLSLSRILAGTYMTSLDGPGFSITLLKATTEMLEYIDAPTTATGWSAPSFPTSSWQKQKTRDPILAPLAEKEDTAATGGQAKLNIDLFRALVSKSCDNVLAAEPSITKSDTIVGDGDCGVTLARGAKAVQSFLSSSSLTTDAVLSILHLASVIEDNMDGTSGAIYSIFFASLASALRSAPAGELSAESWTKVAVDALKQLQSATPARKGDRTLMDALEPFVEALQGGKGVKEAVEEARKGKETTKGMKAAFGRAVYVEESAWKEVPDPGAEGVVAIVEGLLG